MVKGDIRAAIAAVRLGERRMIELFERFGRATVLKAFEASIAETRAIVASRLQEIFPDGSYSFTDKVDRDGHGNGPFALRMTLKSERGRLSIDATGSDDQAPGPVNFLMSPDVPRIVLGIYALSGENSALLNQGAIGAIETVMTRPGSILEPRFPAPLGQRGVTLMRVMSTCLGLINVATGGRGVASNNVYGIWYLRGRVSGSETFLLSDGVAVGYGARPFADGIDTVYLVANENYPAEFLDLSYPVRLLRYGVNPDSGGPGRWRGGCGVIRELEVLAEEAMLSIRIDAVDNPPWGVAGGQNGRGGRCVINPGRKDERVVEPMSDGTILRKGDVMRLETGGGGGFGHPFDREPERVGVDVLGGFVTRERAESDYGVALAGGDIDLAETERLRSARFPTKLFHRGEYYDVLP
jgi:N-methylhydantoinase B